MQNRYAGLSPKEADDQMLGTINVLVADAMDEARAMTANEWETQEEGRLSRYFASAIFYAVQNRLRGAP